MRTPIGESSATQENRPSNSDVATIIMSDSGSKADAGGSPIAQQTDSEAWDDEEDIEVDVRTRGLLH
jgi:hypothetical protein